MRDLIVLIVHLITTVLRLLRPGGVRAVVAESVLVKHQLLILNHSRRRAPNLRILDRLIVGFCSLWIKPRRFCRAAIAFKPSTLLNFHRALVQRKYRLLFSPKQKNKPGPKGPTADLIRSVVEMKQRNPTWGCPHIADQINLAFGTSVNKDIVRRILARHYRPVPTEGGPSWLTFIGHVKDSLWSIGPVSMRIDFLANVLGTGGDGPVHSQNHRFWNTGRHRRRHGALPDVQASHSRCGASEISQFRSRSAVQVSSMGGQPQNCGR
jgi:hypothetical protein